MSNLSLQAEEVMCNHHNHVNRRLSVYACEFEIMSEAETWCERGRIQAAQQVQEVPASCAACVARQTRCWASCSWDGLQNLIGASQQV